MTQTKEFTIDILTKMSAAGINVVIEDGEITGFVFEEVEE